MNIVEVIKKVSTVFEPKEDPMFSFSIENQKVFLENLCLPKDDIERSYNQYLCQRAMRKKPFSFVSNIASGAIILFYIIRTYSRKYELVKKHNAIFLHDGKNNSIIPMSLWEEEYGDIIRSDGQDYVLTTWDLKYIFNIWKRHPLSMEFLLKNVIKIARYRALVIKNNPKAIIVCVEYSYTSSLLTDWCSKNGVQHINVMHGEKLFYIRDSFFRFHKCYVWDEYYVELFMKLRADVEQFIVEVPEALHFSEKKYYNKELDFTYYLMDESKEELIKILDIMKILKNKGYSVAVRPHPRYSDRATINVLFEGVTYIEDGNVVSIEESILRTRNAISLYSTVLNQAYHNGVDIVIDDISDKKKYNKLYELQYRIMYITDKKLLSEIL